MSTPVSASKHELRDAIVALQPRLRRFAYGLCHSLDEADDVVQSAFERALSRLDQWRPGSRLDSWMFRIVHSVFLNQRAKVAVRARYASAVEPDSQSAPSSGNEAESSAMLDRVREHLLELPEAQRAALLLVAVEGLSYTEAAGVLNVPVGTVTSRIARARAALVEKLEPSRVPAITKPATETGAKPVCHLEIAK
ncbi:MAG: RNA polymerase sigma factor [Gammaproteobacteria bacterium]